jgi:hypothetical protein
MSLQEWERDVLNRQRNIVFPDTNLNQGRFYRNIASGKVIFTRGQWISLFVVVLYFFFIDVIDFAGELSEFLVRDRFNPRGWNLGPLLLSLIWLLFWIFLAAKALISAPEPARKRRRGYRQSPGV